MSNKPQSTSPRKHQISSKNRNPDFPKQHTLRINHVDKVSCSGINVARFDYFDAVGDPLVGVIDYATVSNAAVRKDIICVDLMLDGCRTCGRLVG